MFRADIGENLLAAIGIVSFVTLCISITYMWIKHLEAELKR